MRRFSAVICIAAICGFSVAAATPAFDAALAQRLGADEHGMRSETHAKIVRQPM